jgi:arylsulfatase A-like enzyme
VTSDHGEEFMDHGSLLHGRTQYQELLSIPLVLAGPGIPAGGRVAVPVGLVDVAPTILELLGAEPPVGTNGRSLVGLWSGAEDGFERLLYAEADHNNPRPDMKRMVRDRRYKLCYNRFSGETELYDLERDPTEKRDLSSAQPERVEAFLNHLREWMEGEVAGETIEAPSGEELEQLQALGYVDDGG